MIRLARVQAVHDAAVDAKETHHLMGPETSEPLVGLFFHPLPRRAAVSTGLAEKDGQNKVLNIPISNVPGPREARARRRSVGDRDLLGRFRLTTGQRF